MTHDLLQGYGLLDLVELMVSCSFITFLLLFNMLINIITIIMFFLCCWWWWSLYSFYCFSSFSLFVFIHFTPLIVCLLFFWFVSPFLLLPVVLLVCFCFFVFVFVFVCFVFSARCFVILCLFLFLCFLRSSIFGCMYTAEKEEKAQELSDPLHANKLRFTFLSFLLQFNCLYIYLHAYIYICCSFLYCCPFIDLSVFCSIFCLFVPCVLIYLFIYLFICLFVCFCTAASPPNSEGFDSFSRR